MIDWIAGLSGGGLLAFIMAFSFCLPLRLTTLQVNNFKFYISASKSSRLKIEGFSWQAGNL